MSDDAFKTSDIALAAYLTMRGHPILNVNHDGDNKASFQFEDSPGRSKEVLMFFNRQTQVEPMAFLDHLKSLKAMIKQ